MTNLAEFRPRAIVFDLDGTLTDNMPLHADAFAVFADRHGLPPLTLADRRKLDGKRNSEIFPVLFNRAMTEDEWRAMEHEKETLYREGSVGRLRPLNGLLELLAAMDERGIAPVVATSSPKENVQHTLTEIGLPHLLSSVARGDQVPRGKPFPDVFLEAARLVNVSPEQCLAFEDAPMGVEAAVRAGMPCIAVTTSFDRDMFHAHTVPPDAVVRDYADFLAGIGRWLTE